MLTIRKAIIEDTFEIKKLFQETILSVNIKDYSAEQAECWARRGDDNNVWKDRINEQYFIVAIQNNIISGFAALKPDGYLNSMFVHKDYQGIGVASSLLTEIEKYALKNYISEITADVSITAKPFFEKKGYKVITQQTVCIGIEMINYKMKKAL